MQRFSEHAKEIAKLKMEFFRCFSSRRKFSTSGDGDGEGEGEGAEPQRVVDRIWKADLRPHWGVAAREPGHMCASRARRDRDVTRCAPGNFDWVLYISV